MEILKGPQIPDSEAELQERTKAREGVTLLNNTLEQYRRELEELVSSGKITETEMNEEYNNLMQDRERLEGFRQRMLENIKEYNNDKREEIIEELKKDFLERREQKLAA